MANPSDKTYDNFVRIGDLITLKFVRFQSFLSSEGILSEDIFVTPGSNSFEDHLFQVCAQRQYSAKSEYEEFNAKMEGKELNDEGLQKHFSALVRGKGNEMRMNEVYMKHRIGNNVLFGDTVQLLHVKSRKYLTVLPGTLARDERENMSVSLSPEGNLNSWMQLLPRYKIDKEGDRISNNTEVVMRVAERASEHIHCSDRSPTGIRMREVNASMESGSPWRVNIYQSSQFGLDAEVLRVGQLVYIRDPENASNLQTFESPVAAKQNLSRIREDDATVLSDDEDGNSIGSIGRSVAKREEASLATEASDDMSEISITSAEEFTEDNGHVILKPSTDETLNTNAIWVIEGRNIQLGGPINWRSDLIHLRHLNTGRYLSTLDGGEDEYVSDLSIFTTVAIPTERFSLFSLFELHSQNEELYNGKAIQLRQGGMYVERGDYLDRWKCFNVAGSRNRMKATNLIVNRYTEPTVAASESADISMDVHIGMAFQKLLQKYYDLTKVPSIRDNKSNTIWPDIDQSERQIFADTVEKMMFFIKGYPIVLDEYVKSTFKPSPAVIQRRQSLLREQDTLEMLLMMLGKLIPISERLATGDAAPHQFNEGGVLSTARLTVTLCLRMLAELSRGNAENQMLIAEYMGVVLSHCSTEKLAAEVTQEMLSTNRMLQETKMGPAEIVAFSEKLKASQMNAMFLRLIQSCCSCQGVGVSSNQINIAKILLGDYINEFIKINVSYEGSAPMDWTKGSQSAHLYLPSTSSRGDKVEVISEMMGHKIFSVGAPLITLTWVNSDKRVLPQNLFGKPNVKLADLYDKMLAAKEEAENMGSSSLFSTGLLKKASSSTSATADEVSSRETEMKDHIGEFFGAQLSLFADMCLDRNYNVIEQLQDIYSFEAMCTLIRKRSTPSFVKASCLSLLTNMYVDCDPQTSVMLPRLTRTWSEVSTEDAPDIRSVEQDQKNKFALLQVLISNHLYSIQDKPYSLETKNMMKLLHKLLIFSFYGDADRLADVIDPVVMALNRSKVGLAQSLSEMVERDQIVEKDIKTKGRRSSTMDSSKRKNAAVDALVIDESAKPTIDLGRTDSEMEKINEVDKEDDQVEQVRTELKILNFFESLPVTIVMLFLVVISIAQAIYQYISGDEHIVFFYVDTVIFALFAIDVVTRGYCYKMIRGTLRQFATDPFNFLDICVVAIDVATFVVAQQLAGVGNFTKVVKVVRLLRLIRIMRVVRIFNTIAHNLAGMDLITIEWEDPQRYHKTPVDSLGTMVEMATILCTVQLTVEDRNVSLLMHGFYSWYCKYKDDEDEEVAKVGAISKFDEIKDQITELRVSSEAYDDIFVDLLMYSSADLVQNSLNVLMTHHSSIKTLLNNATRMQLLITTRREQQYNKLDKLLLLLKRECDTHDIWGRLLTDDHKHTSDETHRALKEVKAACFRRREVLKFNEDFEPDAIIQDILRNLGCFDICIKFVQLLGTIDPNNMLSVSSRNTRTLALEASELLYWFTLDNPRNQAMSYQHIQFYLKNIDQKVKLHKVLEATFSGNEFLMKSIPKQYINDCVDMIINEGRFMQYLSLLGSIVAVGEKNMIENQYEIIRQLASPGNLKKVLMYFVPVSHPEYQKKLKAMIPYASSQDISIDDLPSDLAYHLNLMALLSGCTVGVANMTTIEAKVQSMYNFVDVVDALLDPECILVAKIRTGMFFYNAMLDVEMRLPSLKDAACMWRLLETFSDVFTFAKDDLRQIEKNGWAAATSSRQKVEYMLVCAMIVHGYFDLYFDTAVFRPEVGQASAVERVHIREKKAYEMMNGMFFKMRSIYEMQSPLLAKEHQELLFKALVALNEANPNKIVIAVENVHDEVNTDYDFNTQQLREEKRLEEFLGYVIKYMGYVYSSIYLLCCCHIPNRLAH